jgi:hypothetical protein
MVRFTNWFATGIATAMLALGSGAVLTGCKSDEPAKSSAQPAKAAPPKGVAPPAGHRMAKVKLGMTTNEVEQVMGSPTNSKSYITGKAFNPFTAYGNDSGQRMEYAYKGEGRVVFAIPRWGGGLKVERIDYDPTEDGR